MSATPTPAPSPAPSPARSPAPDTWPWPDASVDAGQVPASRIAPAQAVVDFWRHAGPKRWFAKDAGFDRLFGEHFMPWHEQAAGGHLAGWMGEPTGALAVVLLLDQFPRNVFRGTTRMYASDAQARQLADRALSLGHDQAVQAPLRLFFYLPFTHSEQLSDQQRSMRLQEPLGMPYVKHAREHLEIIERFGRFPHRNAILGRASTPQEQAFLDAGGFAG